MNIEVLERATFLLCHSVMVSSSIEVLSALKNQPLSQQKQDAGQVGMTETNAVFGGIYDISSSATVSSESDYKYPNIRVIFCGRAPSGWTSCVIVAFLSPPPPPFLLSAYDGGDCCECTCTDGEAFACGQYNQFACIDPEAPCVNDDDFTVDMMENCEWPIGIGNGHCNDGNNNPECSKFDYVWEKCRLLHCPCTHKKIRVMPKPCEIYIYIYMYQVWNIVPLPPRCPRPIEVKR